MKKNLKPDERDALYFSVEERGVLQPIYIDEHGTIINGERRKRAADKAGKHCEAIVISGLSDSEKRQLSLELDLCRKNVDLDRRRALARLKLYERPDDSSRQIGARCVLNHETVESIRKEMEARGEIRQVKTRTGRDKKVYKKFPSIRCKTAREVEKATTLLKILGDDAPKRELGRRLQKSLLHQHLKKNAGNFVTSSALGDDMQLLHKDFRQLDLDIDSVALIYADLPYLENFLSLYGDLGAFAARVLKPGGLLLAYAGSYYLTQAVLRIGGRRFIGCDIDPACVALGLDRIATVKAEIESQIEQSAGDTLGTRVVALSEDKS